MKRRKKLSHYGRGGQVRMVDVSGKPATLRRARAHAFVQMKRGVVKQLRAGKLAKGDPMEIARIAGIAAAKRTAELIPLCHPLPLAHVDVAVELCQNGLRFTSSVRSTGPTGVEMEALTAVTVAALTAYDMCKAVDRGIQLREIFLLEKTGGRSGSYRRRPG